MIRLASAVRNMHRSFVRIHVLSFAVREGEVCGVQVMENLGRFGYAVSPGTLYPTLHELESNGFLRSRRAVTERGKVRRYYAITEKGIEFLYHMKPLVRELSDLLLSTPLPDEAPPA